MSFWSDLSPDLWWLVEDLWWLVEDTVSISYLEVAGEELNMLNVSTFQTLVFNPIK